MNLLPPPSCAPTRVLLVELGGAQKGRLAALLAGVPGVRLVDTVDSWRAAHGRLAQVPADLVLLGLGPGDNAAQALVGLLRGGDAQAGRPEAAEPAGRGGSGERLSAREAQILGLLGQGHTAPEVARQLQLSLHTVNTHLRNSYGKLGARNRLQAVQRARAAGQID